MLLSVFVSLLSLYLHIWTCVCYLLSIVSISFPYEDMAPKADKLPTTNVFGQSKVFDGLIAEYESLGFIEKGKGRDLVLRPFQGPSCGVFISSESPSVVACCLSMSSTIHVFGDHKRKVLQFCSDDRECVLLKEVGDNFGFPIMEDELSKESAKDILSHAQDLSMKSFFACRAAQRHCRDNLHANQLSKKTFAGALSKEIKVVKTPQTQKVSLAHSLDEEKKRTLVVSEEKDKLLKRDVELEAELARLRSLSTSAKMRKRKRMVCRIYMIRNMLSCLSYKRLMPSLFWNMGLVVTKLNVMLVLCVRKFMISSWTSKPPLLLMISALCILACFLVAGRSFGELGVAVSARSLAHSIFSLMRPSSVNGEPCVTVDGVYSYQTSIGLASGQVLCCSQGTLLPSSVNPRYRIRGTNV
jgi:hypothetical protein